MNAFIERIISILKEKNMSKADLFRLSKLKKSTFYNVFSEKTDPNNLSIDTVMAIAKALNTTTEYLTHGDISMKNREEVSNNSDVTEIKLNKNKIRIYKRGGGVEEYAVDDDEIELWHSMLKANKDIKERHNKNKDF